MFEVRASPPGDRPALAVATAKHRDARPNPAAVAPRSTQARRRQLRLGLLFVSPWILGFLAFYLYPFVATLYYSFTSFTGVGNAQLIGFANYSALFHDGTFRTALFNTFYYTVFEVPLSTVAAIGLALLLNMNVRGRAFYRTVFYIPSIVPIVASSLIFVWIFQPSFGVVNSILSGVHITGPTWFFSVAWSKPSFIILGLWGLGQPMVIYLASLQGVPKEMYEVASLEGAGPLQRLRYVTLPMISPIILFNVVLALVTSIQYFTQADIIESPPGSPGTSTMFYVTYLYQQAFQNLHLGYASAMAFLLFVLVLIVTVILFKTSSRWVYYASEQS
jgi:multiple sugar transport system permease protein